MYVMYFMLCVPGITHYNNINQQYHLLLSLENIIKKDLRHKHINIVFDHDMIVQTKSTVDWELIKVRRKELSCADNSKEN